MQLKSQNTTVFLSIFPSGNLEVSRLLLEREREREREREYPPEIYEKKFKGSFHG
jgi:hypothetical protein